MPAFEKKLLTWLQKHMDILLMIGIAALGLLVRYSLCSLHADIPGDGLNKYMIFADLLLAVSAYFLVKTCAADKTKTGSVIAFSVMLFSVGNIFASAAYGRMDGLWAALCLLALVFIIKEKYLWAFVLLSAACFISAYALLILPFIFFIYMHDGRFSIFWMAAPIAAAFLRCLAEIDTAGWFPEGCIKLQLYSAYPSFWGFIREDSAVEFNRYLPLAFVMTLVVLMIFFMVFCRKKYVFEKNRIIWAAFLICFITAMFMPGMGMGAAALYTVLAWLLAVSDPVLIIPALILEVLRIWPQAAEIYGREWMAFPIQGLCWIQAGVLIFYIMYFYKKVLDSRKQV